MGPNNVTVVRFTSPVAMMERIRGYFVDEGFVTHVG
jgi:hypothetical protein